MYNSCDELYTKMMLKVIVSVVICGFVPQTDAGLEFGTHVSGTIKETTTTLTEVACLECGYNASDAPIVPERKITLDRNSISPSYFCGTCFDVYRASDQGSSKSGWCVYYLPSQGQLNYTLVRRYDMRVLCTDGVETIYSDIVIKVSTNEPPELTAAPPNCPDIVPTGTNAGDIVYNGLLNNMMDPEGDKLFCSMTTLPHNDNFEMDSATCEVRAKTSLEDECNPSVTFQINVTDNHNPSVGPITITCPVRDPKQPPIIPNLNVTARIREDVKVGDIAYSMDRITGPKVSYTITNVDPIQAAGLFIIDGRFIRVQEKLDYENPLLQNIRIDMIVDNGNCAPTYQFLQIQIVDVNEPPTLSPKIYYEQVDEERIYVNPRYICDDEDLGDSCTYSIISGNEDGKFQINRDTGEIYSTTYNIDSNLHLRELNHTLEILVLDEKGLNDTAIVNLNIRDINDNAPYFLEGESSLAYTVTECDAPGVLPGGLTAYDEDSDYQGNNIVTFLPARSDCLQIHTDGTVHLLKQVIRPQICSLTTRAVDQGFNPRQQTSQVLASVTVTSSECPPTEPPVIDPDPVPDPGPGTGSGNGDTVTASIVAADSVVTTDGTNIAGTDLGMIFGILGGILGALLLASLLACCCRRWCLKKKTAPFSSDKTVSKQKKTFDGMKKKKKKAHAAAAAAAPAAAVVAPAVVQRFLKIRRKIPFMRVKRRIPIQTVRQVVPVGFMPPAQTTIPIRSAPGSVRTVIPAPPPYRLSGTAPMSYSHV